jgi:cytochrome c oxidase subunit 4
MAHHHDTSHAHGEHHLGEHHHGEHHAPHATPLWLLNVTFVALMVLTLLTVAAIQIDFGIIGMHGINIFVALFIAAIKAILVIAIFMHIKWDRGFHALCAFGSLAFVMMLIGYTLLDTSSYGYERNIGGFDATQARQTPPTVPPAAVEHGTAGHHDGHSAAEHSQAMPAGH